MEIRFLHTNDAHGRLTEEQFPQLLSLREQADLYFDTGDLIKTGNLGIPLRSEPAWGILDRLHCTASVLGNRESHVVGPAFTAKIEGAKHPLLVANLQRRDGSYPLAKTLSLTVQGLKVGVLGVMVPMVTRRMQTQLASAYLWEPPISTAVDLAKSLRAECDLVIALTHIGHRQDVALAEAGNDIDIIFGGHSHTVLESPERVRNTWIAQGGSHLKFAGQYMWDGKCLTGGLVRIRG